MNIASAWGRRGARLVAGIGLLALLAGCASSEKPRPLELGVNPALVAPTLAWTTRIGDIGFALDARVTAGVITLAGSEGVVAAIDGASGRDLWRTQLAEPIVAGVGSDGRFSAVLSKANELIVLDGGKEIWRAALGALGTTAPLVAGGRVFVLTADRSVSAFDAMGGRKLWTYARPGDQSLVLSQLGVLLAVGETLVAGNAGRLIGLSPDDGSLRWEAPIATARGTNDIERLVELVGRASREGPVVCARSFQSAVGCVNTVRGTTVWSKPASGSQGLAGDAQLLFGTEGNGRVMAWKRENGEMAWSSDRLKYRGLSAPLSLDFAVVVGDAQGWVHFLSRADGAPLGRVSTDGSAIAAAPVLVGNTLVVLTQKGGIFGFRPD
ncbi:MAG: outer membrane protein assembly factor BamB [Burkholderiaceae bacterium]